MLSVQSYNFKLIPRFLQFSAPYIQSLPEDSDEYRVREIMVKSVTNFAKFGHPTPDESLLGFRWKPVSTAHPTDSTFDLDCLEVNLPPRMIRNPNQDRKDFWRKIIREHTNLLWFCEGVILGNKIIIFSKKFRCIFKLVGTLSYEENC